MEKNYEIINIKAREILDSRGNPTIEVDVLTRKGFGRGVAPSGASTGEKEAIELRDNDKRYFGKGVKKAIQKVNKIKKEIIGNDAREQKKIDDILIKIAGEQKSELGGNTTTAISLAVCSAAANTANTSIYKYLNPKAKIMPIPFMNLINGGKHAGSGLAIQEFMIVPKKFKKFSDALRAGAEVYHMLGKLIVKKYGPSGRNVGDEGGYAPQIKTTEEALELLSNAILECGYEKEILIALDAAASSFYERGYYKIDGKMISGEELMYKYEDLIKRYPIISIEDPFEEKEWGLLAEFTRRNSRKIQIVGDDYFVSNIGLLRKGIELNSANALLLKVNQIGTLTEAIDAAKTAMENKYKVIVSHRSGETEDTFIADLAVALDCGQIKTGAPARGERTAKYNRLLRIEEEMLEEGKKIVFGS